MKFLVLCLSVCVKLSWAFDENETKNEQQQNDLRGTRTCSMTLDRPVCCNGVNFLNICMASRRWGMNRSDCAAGPCEEEESTVLMFCPDVYDPVCCNGKKQYANACYAAREGRQGDNCMRGSCPEPCVEENNLKRSSPDLKESSAVVCCNETDDYPNLCEASLELLGNVDDLCRPGKCPTVDKTPCGHQGDTPPPVCCDGTQDYSNQCEATQNGFDEDHCTPGSCNPPPPPPSSINCPAVYDPVCCNSVQHPNLCEAARVGTDIASCVFGECP